ncbi:RecQ family ATP-dependent DNA helicase [Shewanella maritima]|uniref:RecQ family ATP-dependent DNA helicase n=1 Tax=Shewanella maritima TaxID=2520507 RepID=UPI003736D607
MAEPYHEPINQPFQAKLKQWFGFDSFNTGQQQVIEHVTSGHSAMAIFPTGSGKSLCYQFSALSLPNVTLVVSPLLALIQDQLDFLHSKGIAAASITSSQTPQQIAQVMQGVKHNEIKILMVSVERFKNERFRQFLNDIDISLLVVDEAHCISEWGHNFRPDYLKIPQYRQDFDIPQVLLLTATATLPVKRDMATRFDIDVSCIVQTGFERKNLSIHILPVDQKNKQSALIEQVGLLSNSEIDTNNTNAPDTTTGYQQAINNPCGIVYVTLQQTSEQLAQLLTRQGFNVKAYHAGLGSEQRQQIQQDFMNGSVDIVVATIAFGMGIDKANIRFVLHYDLPKSIENFSQEIGRAGRDGVAATCVTLANLDNINTVENFVYGDTPQRSDIASLLNLIVEQHESGRWEMQETSVSTHTNIRLLPLKTLLVQLELAGAVQPTYVYFADFKYKFIEDKQAILMRFNKDRQTFLNQVFTHTQFKKIWGQLNFDSLHQAYGHQRQRVVAALDYLAQQDLIELETKKMTQVFQVDINTLQTSALLDNMVAYFEQNECKEIKRIQKLVDLFQTQTCISYGLACYFDDKDATQQCGQCSVCLGEPAILTSTPLAVIDSEQLQPLLTEFKLFCVDKGLPKPSEIMQTKFLSGMAMPIFSRSKIKQLQGFGYYQHYKFTDIQQAIMQVS